MFFFPDLEEAERYAEESSKTTHGATECVDACRLLARIICRSLQGKSKHEVALGDSRLFVGAERIVAIARWDYQKKSKPGIRGSGYVVESFEAVMWCFTCS